jgi:hypothetical protein
MIESILPSSPAISFLFRSIDSRMNDPSECDIGFRACWCCEHAVMAMHKSGK